jgi:UDP:flavonoid glycosyltransferase YjiC (YdhE family)
LRITILALGSRGDVQPFTALGLGLRAAGHAVRIAAAKDYESLVLPYGLDFFPLVGSIHDFMDRQMVAAMLDEPENLPRFVSGMMDAVRPLVHSLVRDCYAASRDAGALVVSTLGLYAGYDVAEKLGIPVYTAHLHPDWATRYFSQVFFPALPPWAPLRGQYNRLSFGLADAAYWAMIMSELNRARRDVLDLPPLSPLGYLRRTRHPLTPVLHGYSPSITRTPPDWGPDVHVTGYWFLDRPPGWQPPPDLAGFLASGPPPVHIGFGSILVGSDPDAVTRLIVGALRKTGQRGILVAGWSGLGNIELPDTVFKIGDVPFDWLFTRVAAVVCHGGAGTTATALRAGVPPVIVPFFGDQHFWARRVHRMGLGPEPVPRRRLTEDKLAAAIAQALDDKAIRSRAARMGRRLACERGVDKAVEIISSSA